MSVVFPLESFSVAEEVSLSPEIGIRKATPSEKVKIIKNFKIEHAWKGQVLEILQAGKTTNLTYEFFFQVYDVISALRLFKRGKVGILEPIFYSIEEKEKNNILTQFYLSDLFEVIKTRGYRPPIKSSFENNKQYLSFFRGYSLRNEEIARFKKCFMKFVSAKSRYDLFVPIIRMNRAQSYNDFIYGIVDSTIALEAILKRKPIDKKEKKKSKKKIKNENKENVIDRCKVLFGYSSDEQKEIEYHLKNCYEIRNSLVHGGGRVKEVKLKNNNLVTKNIESIVENNFSSIKMLESYVPSVITSAIPLYEKYENKEDVLKHIDKFNPQKNADATELHNTIRQFWEA
jgi:hypothetical protein